MKQLFLLSTIVLCSMCANAQDIIIKKNGDEVKSKVVEITNDAIKYRKWENQDGPIYSIDKAEVFKIKYENGQNDFFGNYNAPQAVAPNTPEPKNSIDKEKNSSEYERYNSLARRKIGGGAVMLALGVPCLATGAVLLPIGIALNETYYDPFTGASETSYEGDPFIITSAVLLAAGAALTIAGPIVLSKGVKFKRKARAAKALITFTPIKETRFDNYNHGQHWQKLTALTLSF
jgi:hypothetical protein